jgi:hypothetical protein
VRTVGEEQRRFPLQVATTLSQQFAGHGLQFFKVNRTVTHVWVARPRFLDLEATPVSEGVKRIVDFINTHPKCTRRKLMDTLAPTPAAPAVPMAPPAPTVPVEGAAPVPAPAPVAAVPQPAPEQTALASDLHWLIHEGHVIEFANGILETAKRPLVKPPKPEKAAPPVVTPSSPAPASPASTEVAPSSPIEAAAEAPVAGPQETLAQPEAAAPPKDEGAGPAAATA